MMTDYLTRGQILKKSYGGKEYEIERYQGEHENEYGVFEVKNGVRDGTAELFDDGIVKMRWTMKNGVREGSYVLFDKGVVTGEGKWEDIGKSEDRVVENRRSGLIMVIHFNNAIIYEGGFNEKMQRNGFGLEYENGVLKRGGEWKDDELVYLSQRFLNDSEMIEYSSGSTYDLFSHRPVYIGGYCKDELSGQIVRDGRGRVLDEWSGVCEYESEWDGGKELTDRRVTLREGWYCGHEHQQSTRRVVTGDEPGESMSEDLNESSPFLLTPGSGSSLLNEPVRPNEAVNPNELSTPNESNNLNESLSRVNSTKSTDSTKSNNSSNPIENAKHKLRNLRQFFTIPPRVQSHPIPTPTVLHWTGFPALDFGGKWKCTTLPQKDTAWTTTNVSWGETDPTPAVTHYYRTSVICPDFDHFFALLTEVKTVGGFILYINGMEVNRFGLPRGKVTSATKSTVSSNEVMTRRLSTLRWLFISSSKIEVAVETHTANETTEDGFDCRLLLSDSEENRVDSEGEASHGNDLSKATEDFSHVFDGSVKTKWCYFAKGSPGWIAWTFKNGRRELVNKYAVTTANDCPGRDPVHWRVYGAMEGGEWTLLDERQGVEWKDRFQRQTFSFNNYNSYNAYKFEFVERAGKDEWNMCQMAEWDLLLSNILSD